MFAGPFDLSIVKRAQEKKLADINLHDLRNFAIDERGTVDDRPYGGGAGMIMRIEPIFNALQSIIDRHSGKRSAPRISNDEGDSGQARMTRKIVLLDPRGEKFTQAKSREYSKLDQLILICGHYEGVDERVRENLVDESLSIGDYVLTGGEIPAMVVVDAVTRLLPGVLEKPEATEIESFSWSTESIYKDSPCKDTRLEYSQYTRPEEFNGWKVPEILLSGNHEEIKKWRTKH